MGDGFYRSKDPTNSIKVLKGQISITEKHNNRTINTKHNKSPSLGLGEGRIFSSKNSAKGTATIVTVNITKYRQAKF